MGIIRTLLAISILLLHAGGGKWVFLGPEQAIELFYIVSGFLISYILVEKKNYSSTLLFYKNRYLRLFPIYFLVAFATLVMFYLAAHIEGVSLFWNRDAKVFFSTFQSLPDMWSYLLILSNLFIFGIDLLQFSDINFYDGLLVPQAWTVALELSFYLLAPYILRRKLWVFLLLILSIAIKITITNMDDVSQAWKYGFFPAELCFFLFGSLSHQYLLKVYLKIAISKLRVISTLATLSFLLLYNFKLTYIFNIAHIELLVHLLIYVVFIAIIPLTFLYQNLFYFDRKIGELSYPIYISHVLVISLITPLCHNFFGYYNPTRIAFICLGASIGLAVLLQVFIGDPIELIRNKNKKIRAQSQMI